MQMREDIRNLAPPPRWVSPRVAAELLFGGKIGHFAWFYLCFSLIFVLFFGAADALRNLFAFGSTSIVVGTITRVEETHTSVDGESVWEVRFRFAWDGKEYHGSSYAADPQYDPGEAVDLKVVGDDPRTAGLEEMRRSKSPSSIIFLVLIFPVIGGLLVVFNGRRGFRHLHLLMNGNVAAGTFHAEKTTGLLVNRTPEVEHQFAFTVDGQTFYASGRTLNAESIRDEMQEPIIYDPNRPGAAIPFDVLHRIVKIDSTGKYRPASVLVGWAGLWPFVFLQMLSFVI